MVVGEITEDKDLVVIGGGPGGYHAAIRASQLGINVTLIEREDLGGICLNKGCIPSKVFTHFAQEFKKMSHLSEMGMEFGEVSANLSTLQAYKEKKILQLRKGVEALCKANKIEIVKGTASFLSESRIGVENGHEFSLYNFKDAVIATGGDFYYPEGIALDSTRILSEREIFQLGEIPKDLIVYGADYISLEIASAFSVLGSKVTMIMDEELPFDSSISKELFRLFKKQKIHVLKNTQLLDASVKEDGVIVKAATEKGESISVEGSHFVLKGKVKPNIKELGVDRLDLTLTEDGFIQTDNQGRTSIQSIWAIGDTTEGPSLAVKAIKQGKVVAEAIGDKQGEVDLEHIPTVVQMNPPIAFVGMNEEEAKAAGYAAAVSEYPIRGNGYTQLTDNKDGFIKVISDKESDLILGVHIIGAGAVELISSGVLGMEMVARNEDLIFPLYPHPSLNESLLEAVEGLNNAAVHLPPVKKEMVKG